MCFKLFNKLGSQIKCDIKQTNKFNWIFLGGRMQKLKPGKSVFVEQGQICFLRCKDKTCDCLQQGKYKICEEQLPLLFKRLNVKEINKSLKLKTDVYFVKQNITYNFVFNKQSKLAKLKIKEKISASLTYQISDIMLHTKYIFLEDAVVDNREYNNRMFNIAENSLNSLVENYNGEFSDLMDSDITGGFKAQIQQVFANYGLDVVSLEFKDYSDLTKYKKKKINNKITLSNNNQTKESITDNQDVVIVDYRNYPNKNNSENIEQNNSVKVNDVKQSVNAENTFTSVVSSGKIIINPEE